MPEASVTTLTPILFPELTKYRYRELPFSVGNNHSGETTPGHRRAKKVGRSAASARSKVRRVHALRRRSAVLSLLQLCSIGLKSGEYGGRYSTRAPRARIASAIALLSGLTDAWLGRAPGCSGSRV